MLKLRLARRGAKKRPFYSIVVADIRSPRDGRFIEKLGTYNPMVDKDHPQRIVLKEDRIKHWLAQGAQPTDRVARFLGKAEIIAMPKYNETPQKSQPKQKAQERTAEKEQKRLEAKEAAAQAAEEAVAAEKAAAEEAAAAAAAPTEETPAEAETAPAEAPAEEKSE